MVTSVPSKMKTSGVTNYLRPQTPGRHLVFFAAILSFVVLFAAWPADVPAQQPNKLLIKTLVEVKKLRAEVDRLESENADLRNKINRLSRRPTSDKSSAGLKQEIRQMQAELNTVSDNNRKLQQQIKNLRNANVDLELRLTQATEAARTAQHEQELAGLRKENTDLKQQLTDMQKQHLQLLRQIDKQSSTPGQQAGMQEEELQREREKNEVLRQQTTSLVQERDENKERVIALNMRLETLKKENTQLQQKVKEVQQAPQQDPGLLAEQAELERKNADQAKRLLVLQGQLTALQKENKKLIKAIADTQVAAKPAQTNQPQQPKPATKPAPKPAPKAKDKPASGSKGAKTPPKPASKAATSPPVLEKNVDALTERATYNNAMLAFNNKPPQQGRQALQEFLEKYGDSRYAGEANFWLGESYYREKQFEQARERYQNIVDNFPRSRKYNDARLKLAYTHYELKNFARAKALLIPLTRIRNERLNKLSQKRLERMKREGHIE